MAQLPFTLPRTVLQDYKRWAIVLATALLLSAIVNLYFATVILQEYRSGSVRPYLYLVRESGEIKILPALDASFSRDTRELLELNELARLVSTIRRISWDRAWLKTELDKAYILLSPAVGRRLDEFHRKDFEGPLDWTREVTDISFVLTSDRSDQTTRQYRAIWTEVVSRNGANQRRNVEAEIRFLRNHVTPQNLNANPLGITVTMFEFTVMPLQNN